MSDRKTKISNLQVYRIEHCEEWDRIVRSFKAFDVYYLSGYVKAFQIHGDGEPLLFYYESNGLRGINVVMKRDIGLDSRFAGRIEPGKYYDFVTPYGYGGWLIEGEGDIRELFKLYEEWCFKQHIVSEFVRYHPVLRNHAIPGVEERYDIQALGGTIAMDLRSPEVIWENMTSKNRNMIRKAQKKGVLTYSGRYPSIFEKFRVIYNETMDKDDADPYYYFGPAFYKSVMNDLAEEAQVFYAEFEEKVIAVSIILRANDCLNYHLSGSLREYSSFAAGNLLLYQAALWGSANGCKTFHLGGGVGSQEDGLYKFKASFYRGEPCRFHIGRKVLNTEKYEDLILIRGNADHASDSGFFPKYRA